MTRIAVALLLALPLLAGEPSPIEDQAFFAESAWAGGGGASQYAMFVLRDAHAFEVAQVWSPDGGRSHFGYTVPLYRDERTGLGDVAVHFRRQLAGNTASRCALAARASMILPTRHAHFGGSSAGVQVNIPLSVRVHERLSTHTNLGATWFRSRENELSLAQSVALDLPGNVTFSVEGAYTRAAGGDALLVVRPGVQLSIETPAGLTIVPGIAAALGDRSLLFHVGVEMPFGD
jgi:hypothetical protein